jgi:hypothetical protein
MLNFIYATGFVFGLYIIIATIWGIAEKAIYGQVTPRVLDSLVALALAISLYNNFN